MVDKLIRLSREQMNTVTLNFSLVREKRTRNLLAFRLASLPNPQRRQLLFPVSMPPPARAIAFYRKDRSWFSCLVALRSTYD
jgi:hypothetical protein